MTSEAARPYIATVRWQFAKKMPHWPHEYTVRDWLPDLEYQFLAFVELIREEGEIQPWLREAPNSRYHHTYAQIRYGWEYRTMGAPVEETTVINRARP